MSLGPTIAAVPWVIPPEVHVYCDKRLASDEEAVRTSNARRSAFKRPTAFRRPAASSRPEFLELLVTFEAGIVIFPPGPGAAASSRESNWSVLLRLIAGPVVFPRRQIADPLAVRAHKAGGLRIGPLGKIGAAAATVRPP